MRFAVKEMREMKGLTIEELAEKTGISIETIMALENNTVDSCSSKDLCLIADTLGISVKKIFTGKGATF